MVTDEYSDSLTKTLLLSLVFKFFFLSLLSRPCQLYNLFSYSYNVLLDVQRMEANLMP